MSDTPPREWRFYVDDFLGEVDHVIVYTHDLDQAAFVASGLNYDATVRNLDRIGEAAIHVLDTVRPYSPA